MQQEQGLGLGEYRVGVSFSCGIQLVGIVLAVSIFLEVMHTSMVFLKQSITSNAPHHSLFQESQSPLYPP